MANKDTKRQSIVQKDNSRSVADSSEYCYYRYRQSSNTIAETTTKIKVERQKRRPLEIKLVD